MNAIVYNVLFTKTTFIHLIRVCARNCKCPFNRNIIHTFGESPWTQFFIMSNLQRHHSYLWWESMNAIDSTCTLFTKVAFIHLVRVRERSCLLCLIYKDNIHAFGASMWTQLYMPSLQRHHSYVWWESERNCKCLLYSNNIHPFGESHLWHLSDLWGYFVNVLWFCYFHMFYIGFHREVYIKRVKPLFFTL